MHIRVNPQSMTAYGNQATEIFGSMHTELTNLVNEVTTVQFFGPNAVDFKTKSGTLAQTFAQSIHKDLSTMAEAVRASVSNIQGSLGGATVSIQVDGKTIEAPAVQSVDYVDVDTTALEGLTSQVTSKFSALQSFLENHMTALTNTDWEGNAKQQATSSCQTVTNTCKTRCTEAEQSINKFITQQLESVTAADA